MRATFAATFVITFLLTPAPPVASAQTRPSADDVAARLQALEAREAIRTLWAEYGRTLDARDFAAFGRLFARDGEFAGGGGTAAKGPAAVAAMLEKAIGTNYPASAGRNFHLYFNETIEVNGDQASGVSRGGFVMANEANTRVDFLLLATYVDQFVREDGVWKFKRREVQGNIPVPRRR